MLRVIYTSISRLQGPVLAEMRRIRDQAGRHNGPDGIRVALLHKSGYFVQWAEGPPRSAGVAPQPGPASAVQTMDRRHRSE
ncbi:MAG: BLUF domain-containing protein [Hydrogenophaga sp.]|nr:BLUF domain-containing protein [Hydrogenophaga sp.]